MTTQYDIVLSSGHAKYVRGAAKYLDEVNEARKIVNKVASLFEKLGGKVVTFHDDTSKTQTANINKIVSTHNAYNRKYDISVHLNANVPTTKKMGVEVLYLTSAQKQPAAKISAALAKVMGLPDRGAKYRNNLGFLNGTTKPALLIEICFVDSTADKIAYTNNFDEVCASIAKSLASITDVKAPVKKPTTTAETKEPVKATSKKYYVLTGAYDSKAQADSAVKKTKEAKIAWVCETVKIGSKYHLKTGTYDSKAQAEAAFKSMKAKSIAWMADIKSV